MIPLEDAGPLHAQLADAPARQLAPASVDHFHAIREHRHAGKPFGQRDGSRRNDLRHRCAGELDHAVRLKEQRRHRPGDAPHLLEPLGEIGRHHVGGAGPDLHARQIALLGARVEHRPVHRGHADEHVGLLTLDRVEDSRGVEASEETIGYPAEHQRDRRRQAHDVRDGKSRHGRTNGERQPGGLQRNRRQHRQKPVVREPRALRASGRSRGVHHGDHGVGSGRHRRRRQSDAPGAGRDVDRPRMPSDRKPPLHPLHASTRADGPFVRRGVGDHSRRVGELDERANLLRFEDRVDRHGDTSGANDRENRQQEVDAVGRHDRDQLAERQPGFDQRGREAPHRPVDVFERELPTAGEHRALVETEREPVLVHRSEPLGEVPDRQVAPKREQHAPRQGSRDRFAEARRQTGKGDASHRASSIEAAGRRRQTRRAQFNFASGLHQPGFVVW